MTNAKELNSNFGGSADNQHSSQSKDQQKSLSKQMASSKEHSKMHPIFSKASLSKEKHRESENFSKHQSSSDSSFQQAFEQILLESESLKFQLEEILLGRMSPSDPVYSEFIERIVAKNKERQQKIFNNSQPLL